MGLAEHILAVSAIRKPSAAFAHECWWQVEMGGTWEGTAGRAWSHMPCLQPLARACSAVRPARPPLPLRTKRPSAALLIAFSKNLAFSQLTAKATLNDYVKTISLPKTSSDLPTGTKCSIAGWGLIDNDQATNKLFETKVSIYSRRKCIRFYPHLDTGMVCAGSFHELRDSSQVQTVDGLGAQGRPVPS